MTDLSTAPSHELADRIALAEFGGGSDHRAYDALFAREGIEAAAMVQTALEALAAEALDHGHAVRRGGLGGYRLAA